MGLPIGIEFNLGFVTSFYFPFPELASHISHGHETGNYHNVRITQEMLLGSSPRLLRCLTTDFITCCTRVYTNIYSVCDKLSLEHISGTVSS